MTELQSQQYQRIDQAIKAIITPATQGFYTEDRLFPLLSELETALVEGGVDIKTVEVCKRLQKRLRREFVDGPVTLDGFIEQLIAIEHQIAHYRGRPRYVKTTAKVFYYGNRTSIDGRHGTDTRPAYSRSNINTERMSTGARHVLGLD